MGRLGHRCLPRQSLWPVPEPGPQHCRRPAPSGHRPSLSCARRTGWTTAAWLNWAICVVDSRIPSDNRTVRSSVGHDLVKTLPLDRIGGRGDDDGPEPRLRRGYTKGTSGVNGRRPQRPVPARCGRAPTGRRGASWSCSSTSSSSPAWPSSGSPRCAMTRRRAAPPWPPTRPRSPASTLPDPNAEPTPAATSAPVVVGVGAGHRGTRDRPARAGGAPDTGPPAPTGGLVEAPRIKATMRSRLRERRQLAGGRRVPRDRPDGLAAGRGGPGS